ncbi:MAG: EAL domain-containing protein [Deltaproteobacteria bacterium]|nr:EAL domain-containing protein [Deltaproteobacteria bacterium]
MSRVRLSYASKVVLAALVPCAAVLTVLLVTQDYEHVVIYIAATVVPIGLAATAAIRWLVARPIARLNRKTAALASIHETAPDTSRLDGIAALEMTFERMSKAIRERETSMKRVIDLFERAERSAGMGSWKWDMSRDGEVECSKELYRLFGQDPGEFTPTYDNLLACVHPDDRDTAIQAVEEAARTGGLDIVEYRIVRKDDGAVRWLRWFGEMENDEEGRPSSVVGTVLDITEKKEIEDRYLMLAEALEHSTSIVFLTDVKGNIRYANRMFEKVTGYTVKEVLGKTPAVMKSGTIPDEVYKDMWSTLESGGIWRGVITNKSKEGRLFDVKAVITPVVDDSGRVVGYMAVQEDLTQRQKAERRERFLATHEKVSGLLNRRGLLEGLQDWVQRNRGGRGRGVLILADLDNFRVINEGMGHSRGDEILNEVARKFEGILRELTASADGEPLVARMYGDEYAAFVPGLDAEKALELSEAIRLGVEAYGSKTGHIEQCTISLGVALFPEHGTEVTDLVSRADAALFRAKEKGRNRVHMFSNEDRDIEDQRLRLRQRDNIVKALDEDRFIPFFQPILDLRNNKIHHFEALARMRDEQGEYQTPWMFIDTAETFGLVGRIDRAILERTLDVLHGVRKKGKEASFAVNLSGKDMADVDFLAFIKDKVACVLDSPGSLVFELTETQAVRDLDVAAAFMRDIKAKGCRFALDDFGVGFASFTYLKALPVDMVKIDGSFVKSIDKDRADRRFVKAMVEVCMGMGIETVAEFVENADILEVLKDIGVDYAQGYYVARPAPELVWNVAV